MTSPPEPPPSAAWAAPGATVARAPWAPPGAVGPAVRPTVNGFAVAAFVLGLLCWCGSIPGILAVIFGYVALGQIARSEGAQKGRGFAITGIVLGWIAIVVLTGLALFWFIYGLTNF